MLSITDPGIPNGLTGNLAALMQTLIEKPMHERQMALEQQRANNESGYRLGTLAENIRNHDMLDKYHAGEVDNGQTRAATGAQRAGTYQQSVDQTGATGQARVDETVRHDQATEGRAGENADAKTDAAVLARASAMHNSWMQTQYRPPTPEAEAAHFDAMHKLAQQAIMTPSKPAPTAQPAIDATAPVQAPAPAAPQVGQPPAVGQAPRSDAGYYTNANAQTPTLPQSGPRLQGPAGPPSTQMIQLLHRAQQWKVLPSLSDKDKQKVAQAIETKNFTALAAMEDKLGKSTPGAYAR